jgi:excisionase family DNA binding protein
MTDLPETPFFRVRDVAGVLAVSLRTVYHRIARGQLPAVRTPGGGLRVPRAALLPRAPAVPSPPASPDAPLEA